MSSNSYLVLTEQGLSAMAMSTMPQMAIKYFIPMYDERIDTLIHGGAGNTAPLALASAITSADTFANMYGDRIFKANNAYSLTSNNVATSGVGSSRVGNVINNTTVVKTNSRTLYNGSSLSPVFSGSVSPTYDNATSQLQFIGGNVTTLSPYAWSEVNASNLRSYLFNSVTFTPNVEYLDANTDVINGVFTFELRNDIGGFRFNKLAFFVQPCNADNTDNVSYNPILFGQAVFSESQIITTGGTGSQIFNVSVQLSFTIKDGTTIVTNNDHWTKIPTEQSVRNKEGLFFQGDVALGSGSVPNSWQPKAKFHITDETDVSQIRLSNTNADGGADLRFDDTIQHGRINIKPADGDYTYPGGFGVVLGNSTDVYGGDDNLVAYAIGDLNVVEGRNAVAIGESNTVDGDLAFAIGIENVSKVDSNNGAAPIAIGFNTSAFNNGASIGYRSYSKSIDSNPAFSIGYYTSATGAYSVSIGNLNSTETSLSYAFGSGNRLHSGGSSTLALGFNNLIGSSTYAHSFGDFNSFTNSIYTFAFGANNALTSTSASISFGFRNINSNGNGFTFGNDNTVHNSGFAFGDNNDVASGFAFGIENITADKGIAIGFKNYSVTSGYSIGKNNTSDSSYVFGVSNNSTLNSYAFGNTNITSNTSYAVGAFNNATNSGASIGHFNQSNGGWTFGMQNSATGGVAVGKYNNTTNMAFGYSNTGAGLSFGHNNSTPIMAFGFNNTNGIAFGSYNSSTAMAFGSGNSGAGNSFGFGNDTSLYGITFGKDNTGSGYKYGNSMHAENSDTYLFGYNITKTVSFYGTSIGYDGSYIDITYENNVPTIIFKMSNQGTDPNPLSIAYDQVKSCSSIYLRGIHRHRLSAATYAKDDGMIQFKLGSELTSNDHVLVFGEYDY